MDSRLLLASLLAFALISSYAYADVLPVAIKITNSTTGSVLPGQVNITARIFDAASGGSKLWEENHTNRAAESDGNTYLALGRNTSLDVSLTYEGNYLEFVINSGDPLRPRTEMTSVASALQVNLSRPQTGFLPQSKIAGITIPFANTTGQVDQSRISGITIPFSNTTGQVGQDRIAGITIPIDNATGQLAQSRISGITIPFDNTTGQVLQSRIAGIAIPASNVTNGTFATTNYVFPENVTIGKTLTATNLSGSILCSNIVGGSDSDYCADASGGAGASPTIYSAANISSEGVFGANTSNAAGNYRFPRNLTIGDKLIGDGSLLFNLNATAITSGFISQAFISGITIPAGNISGFISQSQIAGITIPFDNTTGQVSQSRIAGITIPFANTTGQVGQDRIAGITIPSGNISGFITQSQIAGITIPFDNTTGQVPQSRISGITIPFANTTGQVSQARIDGITIPASNVSNKDYSLIISQANISGITIPIDNVTGQIPQSRIGGITLPQSNITGITIPSGNVTNATAFSTATGLVFTFPNNVTVVGNLTASNLTGKILCNQIVGGSDSDYCADATGSGFAGVYVEAANISAEGIFGANTSNAVGSYRFPRNLTIGDKLIADLSLGFNINATALTTGEVNSGLLPANVTELGQTIEQSEISGITLPAGNISGFITQSQISGITIPIDNTTGQLPQSRIAGITIPIDNTTGQVPQSRIAGITIPIGNVTGQIDQSKISGITIPANNVTNGTFASTNYVFPQNVTVNRLIATNLSGSILCSNIVGGSDPDYCADATSTIGQILVEAANISAEGIFGANTSNAVGNYRFPRNLTIGDKILGDASLLFSINATALATGTVDTGLLAANVTELGQTIEQSEITGITIPFANTTGQVDQSRIAGITIPIDNTTGQLAQSRIAGITIPIGNVTGQIDQSKIAGITIPFANTTGQVDQSRIAGIIIPISNVTGQIDQSKIAGITIPAGNVTTGAFPFGAYTFLGNITLNATGTANSTNAYSSYNITLQASGANFTNATVSLNVTFVNIVDNGGYAHRFAIIVNQSERLSVNSLGQLIANGELLYNLNATAITSGFLSQSRINGIIIPAGNISGFITQSQIAGITIPFANTTGQVGQDRIAGITIPFANTTGQVDQSRIAGITIPIGNTTGQLDQSRIAGITLPAGNVSGFVTQSQIAGITIPIGNVTGQIDQSKIAGITLPQSNITGITIPASNVTTGTFPFGAYRFLGNVTINATGTANSTNAYGSYNITLQASGANFTNATAALNVTLTNIVTDGGYAHRFAVFVNGSERFSVNSLGQLIGNGELLYNLNASAVATGFISQAFISGITIPIGNVTGQIDQSKIAGITIPFANTTGQVGQDRIAGITIPIDNTTGQLAQSRISGITIPIGNVTGQIDQSKLAGVTIPASNVTNATFSTSAGLVFTFPNNLTVSGNLTAARFVGDGSTIHSLNATAITTGFISQAFISGITIPFDNTTGQVLQSRIAGITIPIGNVTGQIDQSKIAGITIPIDNTTGQVAQSRISGITIPASNVTGKDFSLFVSQANITGITIPIDNVTGQIPQSKIGGVTIPASNVTNATFPSGIFTFRSDLVLNATGDANTTLSYNSSAFVLQGTGINYTNATTVLNVTLKNIVTDSSISHRFAVFINGSERLSLDSLGRLITDGQLLFNLNATSLASGEVNSGLLPANVTELGQTIEQSEISGITIPIGNTTGFLGQDRISGITVPAGNISGFVAQSQISGITIPFDNTTGQVPQSRISGITIPIDNVTGQIAQSKIAGITIPASNVTNATFSTSSGLVFTFPNNLTVNGNLTASFFIGDGSLLANLNATAITSGFLPQSRISGITLPAGNISGFIAQSQISGIIIPIDNTTGQVPQSRISGITIPIDNTTGQLSQSRIAGITIPAGNVTGKDFSLIVSQANITGITIPIDNVTGQIAQSRIAGITIPAANVTNATFPTGTFAFRDTLIINATGDANTTLSYNSSAFVLQGTGVNYTNATTVLNVTIRNIVTDASLAHRFAIFINGSERFSVDSLGRIIGDGSLLHTLNATAITTGFISQAFISGITIPIGNVTGQIDQSKIAGITIPFANTTGQVDQSRIAGITLPAGNISGFVTQSQIAGITIPFANTTGQVGQERIAGITIPIGNVTGQIDQSKISGITIPASNVTNATFATSAGLVFTFPNNLTVSGNVSATRFVGDGSTLHSLNATAITSGTLDTGLLAANVTELGQTIEQSEISGITLPQSNITGITIPASNVTGKDNSLLLNALNITNGTFGAGNYIFLNNVSITGNLTIDNLTTGSAVNCLSIVGGTDADPCVDATGAVAAITLEAANVSSEGVFGANSSNAVGNYRFPRNLTIGDKLLGDGSLLFNLNATAIANGELNSGLLPANVTELGQTIEQSEITGITIPASNVTSKDFSLLVSQANITGITIPASNVTGKDFSLFVSQANITGITIPFDNTTGQVAQSRIAGITIPASNVTTGRFPFGAYTFVGNITLNATNTANSTNAYSSYNITLVASGANFTNATNDLNVTLTNIAINGGWSHRFAVFVNQSEWFSVNSLGQTIADCSLCYNLNATAIVSGVFNTGLLAANVTELGQTIEQSEITGITIPFDNTTGQVAQSRISGISIPLTNVTIGESSAKYNFTANQTYKIGTGNNMVCFERAIGTQANYTKCWNGTHVIEQIGVFVILP